MAIPPAPVIEGALKSTINSIGFGLITAVLAITFGRCFIPNFFVIVVSLVVFLEVVLLIFIPKRKEEYELFQAPSRRVTHNIGGADVPQINVQGPEGVDGTPKKKQGIRERLKKDGKQGGKKDQLDPHSADNPDGASASPKRSPSPKKSSPKMERKAKEGEESKPSQGSGQSGEQEDKGKGKGKTGWRKRLASKSQSEEST